MHEPRSHYSGKEHAKGKCPVNTKCQCLLKHHMTFWHCCGWYCDRCKNLLDDIRKDRRMAQ